jgi:hypothetical protein
MLVYRLAYSSNLKMVATCSSVTSVDYTPIYPRRKLFITTTVRTSKLTFIMTRSISSLLENAMKLYPPRKLITSQILQQNSNLNTEHSIYSDSVPIIYAMADGRPQVGVIPHRKVHANSTSDEPEWFLS